MVTAVKALPTQQQLLLCAATSLLGAEGPPPGIGGYATPATSLKQRRSSLAFGSPLSVSKQVRVLIANGNQLAAYKALFRSILISTVLKQAIYCRAVLASSSCQYRKFICICADGAKYWQGSRTGKHKLTQWDDTVTTLLQRRLSFGCDTVRTPGRINMLRPSSTSDASRVSCGSTRQRDCQLGQLHTAYFALCKKVRSSSCCLSLLAHSVSCATSVTILPAPQKSWAWDAITTCEGTCVLTLTHDDTTGIW